MGGRNGKPSTILALNIQISSDKKIKNNNNLLSLRAFVSYLIQERYQHYKINYIKTSQRKGLKHATLHSLLHELFTCLYKH